MTAVTSNKRQSIDWTVIGIYLLLVFIGWMNIYASVYAQAPSSIFDWDFRCGKQFVWILTSLGLAGFILFVLPPKIWEGLSIPFYLAVLGLLVLVIFVSKDVKGSHSWFELGPVKFQPAEISKISTSLLLALVLSRTGINLKTLRGLAIALAIVGLPMLIIIGESETGSALVFTGFLFVLYREGMSGWWLGTVGIVIALFIGTLTIGPFNCVLITLSALIIWQAFTGPYKQFWIRMALLLPVIGMWIGLHYGVNFPSVLVPALCIPPLAWYAFVKKDRDLAIATGILALSLVLVFSTDYIFQHILQPHQRVRIEVLLGLKEDPAGVGYNVTQSKIAIGSGGFFGKGFLKGTQTGFGFVPEQSTDFIFCTVGEEWGFFGCLVVILLYAFLIVRIILDAERCRTAFVRIYGYCVSACIFMHLFINIGMTVGLMPVIGIPLPLLSYGGSSLWAFTILIFIFLALYRDEKKYF